jgi:tetratricopeptide (TPR) repeat protein
MIMRQTLQHILTISILSTFIFSGCDSPQSEKRAMIVQSEKALLSDTTFSPDAKHARELLSLYDEYAKQFPADTLSAEYLFKAGEVATGINDPAVSLSFYRRLYDQYPGYSKAPVALFLQGFIYENQLGQLDSASYYYKAFLERFPDHPISSDVRLSLENLGKSPEELIKMFQEQQKLQADSAALAVD